MQVKLLDLAREREAIGDQVDEAIHRVLDSGRFIKGPEMFAFEQEFAAFCGAAECVAVGNGTDALEIALKALSLDCALVIVPALTFIATAEAVVNAGGDVIFADVGLDGQILPGEIERLCRKHVVDAVVPVHLWGQAMGLDDVLEVAERYQLIVVEDCAQAHGLRFMGKHVGNFGTVGCFSFYPGKNMGAYGDAGAVITNDEFLASTMRSLRDHGRAMTEKYRHQQIGRNSRMDEVQAAILRVKLRYLTEWNERRREIARRYFGGLLGAWIVTDDLDAVYHQFVIETLHRDKLRAFLKEAGIETGIHYPLPLHHQPAFAWLDHEAPDLPNAERLAKRALSLPMHPFLKVEEVDFVIDRVNEFYGLMQET